MEYPNPGVRIVSFGAGRFSGAQEFKHGALSYRDESMDGLEAHLGEGVPLGRHNSAISRCRLRRAGATGVAARAGRGSRESCGRRPDPRWLPKALRKKLGLPQ